MFEAQSKKAELSKFGKQFVNLKTVKINKWIEITGV